MKKTPLEKQAEEFIRDFPRGVYKLTTTASKKRSISLKQSRIPRRVIKRGANIK